MRSSPVLACLWPGLPRLWYRGEWTGLALAIAFAILLNGTLLATFVWPDTSHSALPWIGWLMIGGIWVSTTWYSFHRGLGLDSETEAKPDLFPRAQREYLRGHWYEAETTLQDILCHAPRDLESRLLLATLYRRTERIAEATSALDSLARLEGAELWQLEIRHERKLLEQLLQSPESENDTSNDGKAA